MSLSRNPATRFPSPLFHIQIWVISLFIVSYILYDMLETKGGMIVNFIRFLFIIILACSMLLIGCDDNSITPDPIDENTEKPQDGDLD